MSGHEMEEEKPIMASPKKSNKPQMEKKRRERINNSLNELKSLILGAMKKDASYYSKLEKADILEMAVDHVRNLQKQLRSGPTTDADPMAKYRAGFVTCASEVAKLVMGFPGLDESVKFNVMKHLANCCSGDQTEEATENALKAEIKPQPIKNPERIAPVTSCSDNTKLQSPLSQISQIIDSRTIGEKRLIYQQICNLQRRSGFSPNIKTQHGNLPPHVSGNSPHGNLQQQRRSGNSPHGNLPLSRSGNSPHGNLQPRRSGNSPHDDLSPSVNGNSPHGNSQLNPNGNLPRVSSILNHGVLANNQYSFNKTTDSEKGQQMKIDVKPTSNGQSGLGWINTNERQCSTRGFKLPQKACKPECGLIKPVPQMADKIIISNGIRFMPATVLVPVQVGYSTEDYKQSRLVDEKIEVWRPWEKIGQFDKESQNKFMASNLVS